MPGLYRRAFPAEALNDRDLDRMFPWERAHSWVAQYLQMLRGRFLATNVTISTWAGGPQLVTPTTNKLWLPTPASDPPTGLTLGHGNTLGGRFAYAMEDECPGDSTEFGAEGSDLAISNVTATTTKANLVLTRTYTHRYSSTLTVTEQGLVSWDGVNRFLLALDHLGAPIELEEDIPTAFQYLITALS